MSQANVWHWPLIVTVLLLGLWYFVCYLRAARMSGYSFYTVTAVLQGVSFFLAAILMACFPAYDLALFIVLGFFPNALGRVWAISQAQEAEKDDPQRWAAWRSKVSQLSILNRLFLA
jgi:hypothetical protein